MPILESSLGHLVAFRFTCQSVACWSSLIVACTTVLVGCDDRPGGSGGGSAGSSGEKITPRQAELIEQMREDLANAKPTVATPPMGEVRKRLVGAWRVEAGYRNGQWKARPEVGKSQDIEFRDDGTMQVYLLTHKLEGTYTTKPGEGCVDINMSIGKQPYNYVLSATFEDDMLILSTWERSEGLSKRMFPSVAAARKDDALTRYYRVSGFRADE